MGLETGSYISDLNASNPAATDAKSAGDDHLRLIKSTVKATFPNITGAVTPTHTELNYVDGVTSNIQDQIDNVINAGLPLQTGNGGKFLTTNGSAASWAAVITSWTEQTDSATLVKNSANRYATTGKNYTLPTTVSDGDEVLMVNTGTSITNVLVRGSGQTIMGLAADMTLDLAVVNVKYVSETTDWRLI